MATISVPKRHGESLSLLAKMAELDYESLLKKLRDMEPALSIMSLEGCVKDVLTDLDSSQVRQFASAILSARGLMARRDWMADHTATLIAESSTLDVDEQERPMFQSRMTSLLEVPALRVLSRAIEIATGAERIFHDASIVSDIRSIFPSDVSEQPQAAVIVHTLTIEYHQDGEHRSFFVSLSKEDLEDLKETVSRAITKEKSLQTFVKGSGIPLVELETD